MTSYITSTMVPDDVTFVANMSDIQVCDHGQNFTDCESMHQEFLQANKLVFGKYHVIRISVTWSFFFISAIGNLMSLWGLLTRKSSSKFGFRHLSNTQLIMLHMTLADLVFTFVILPTDAVWNFTRQWVAGDSVCKMMHYLKYFAMYSSSGMIMAMVFDRMLSILRPANYLTQKRQTKYCIGIAWMLAIVNSIPVSFFFGLISHQVCRLFCPNNPTVTQCVDFSPKRNQEQQKYVNLYYMYSMMMSFFVPVITIIICQSLIGIEISKIAVRDKKMMGRRHSETTKSINRARHKSLMLTIILTTMFCVCWGPYYVRGIIYWFRPSLQMASRWVELWMHASMYMNPSLHPLFLAIFMKDVRRPFAILGKKIKKSFDCFRWQGSEVGSGRGSVDERHQMLTLTTRLQSEGTNGKHVTFTK